MSILSSAISILSSCKQDDQTISCHWLKVARDVESYAVEAAFLACASGTSFAAALAAAEVRVPRCFAADLRPCDDDPIESAFALLMEDFAPEQGGLVLAHAAAAARVTRHHNDTVIFFIDTVILKSSSISILSSSISIL